jgi:hypothetical protein
MNLKVAMYMVLLQKKGLLVLVRRDDKQKCFEGMGLEVEETLYVDDKTLRKMFGPNLGVVHGMMQKVFFDWMGRKGYRINYYNSEVGAVQTRCGMGMGLILPQGRYDLVKEG